MTSNRPGSEPHAASASAGRSNPTGSYPSAASSSSSRSSSCSLTIRPLRRAQAAASPARPLRYGRRRRQPYFSGSCPGCCGRRWLHHGHERFRGGCQPGRCPPGESKNGSNIRRATRSSKPRPLSLTATHTRSGESSPSSFAAERPALPACGHDAAAASIACGIGAQIEDDLLLRGLPRYG